MNVELNQRRAGKTQLIKNLAVLAMAKGKDIWIGSSNPSAYYHDLRELLPHAIIVIEDDCLIIKGSFHGRKER